MKKPSRGVIISAWILIVFSILQLVFVPSTFREFSFLPAWALLSCVIYLSVYNFGLLYGAVHLLRLEHWARGLIIILLIVGLADKALFVPLRHKGLDRVRTDPQLRSLLLQEYRKSLPMVGTVSDDALIARILNDLHRVQRGMEVTWIGFLLILLVFYSNPVVRLQFAKDAATTPSS